MPRASSPEGSVKSDDRLAQQVEGQLGIRKRVRLQGGPRRLPDAGIGSGLDRANDRHHVGLAVPQRHSLGVQGVADIE